MKQANPSLRCYPQPGKGKSRRLLEAFAAGAGGEVVQTGGLQDGPAAFYGTVGIESLFREARASRDWFYLDNAFFDCARGTHFRAAKNALQASSCGPDWNRSARIGIAVQPWQRGGAHVVVVEQSDYFMREVAGCSGSWLEQVTAALKVHTDRELRVRRWNSNKGAAASTLAEDLKGAWALVTHMSAAANEALLAGVPVFCTGSCAALPMGLSQLEQIENPRRPDGRQEWAAGLAGLQWTLEELREGAAWRRLGA